MGLGKTQGAVVCASFAMAAAVVASGCGTESHTNDPRPAQPTQVTANIGAKAITISPRIVGVKGQPSPTLSQNEGIEESDSGSTGPLTVIFSINNAIPRPTRLSITGATKHLSNEVVASGTGNFSVDLETGTYTVRAVGMPTVAASNFTVGENRPSSDNQLLLP